MNHHYRVVSITNITSKPFTHAYDGDEYTLVAGETQYMPHFLAKHLATHMARRILLEKYKSGMNDKGVYFNDNPEFDGLMARILGGVLEEVKQNLESERDRLRRTVSSLNEKFGTKASEENVTKKEIMAELDAMGIKYDYSKKKEELMEILAVAKTETKSDAGSRADQEAKAAIANSLSHVRAAEPA